MPGLYHGNDYDLAGFIVGIVEKDSILKGQSIKPGDAILGLPSTGLHTNGYSLARRVLGETASAMAIRYPGLGSSIGEALLAPHRSYLKDLKPVLGEIKGLAHITGGGFIENIPRTLPPGTAVRIDKGSWNVLPVFDLIQELGNVADAEMYRVFNMGIGMTIFADPTKVTLLLAAMPEAKIIGEVTADEGNGRVIIE
jgi:phosphoribosylformylglycinamidine cyclo-ligase